MKTKTGFPVYKVACVALAALFLLGVSQQQPALAQASGAPELKTVEPKDIKELVAKNKGKVVLLNFFATWCVPCHTEFPDIVKLQNKYKSQGLQVIEVSMNDISEKDEMQKFLTEQKPPFPVYLAASTDDDFYKAVDTRWDTALPMTLIYDRDGKARNFYVEGRNLEQFEKDIAPLLAAAPSK
ncbi:MAG: TlpA family protein disulfide reductase [Acidobacteriia bacterium]|nr:TlpA family protein disulfide reductase [Terriglobia bacterium]